MKPITHMIFAICALAGLAAAGGASPASARDHDDRWDRGYRGWGYARHDDHRRRWGNDHVTINIGAPRYRAYGYDDRWHGWYPPHHTRHVYRPVVTREVVWVNPSPVYRHYTLLSAESSAGNGRYCREYQAQGQVGSRTREVYGTACLQPDGAWEIVN